MATGQTPLGRDIVHALEFCREIEVKAGRVGVSGPIRLRAARAAWLVGDLPAAREHYRLAATQLLNEAQLVGQPTFTYCALAELALGAAWMSEDNQVRVAVYRSVLERADAADPPARFATKSPTRLDEPLLRVTYALTKVRQHWYQGMYRALKNPTDKAAQSALMRDLGESEGWLLRLARNARALDGQARDLWLSSRGPFTLALIKAASEAAQRDLDQALLGGETLNQFSIPADTGLLNWLEASAAQPPTIMDLVDEELISVVDFAKRLRMRLPDQVPATVEPGGFARDVGT